MNARCLAAALLLALPAAAQDAPAGIAAWDSVRPSADPLAPEALAAKAGWTAIARDQTVASFKGDAVVTNGRILAVARAQGQGLDVYSVTPEKTQLRARIALLGAGAAAPARLDRAALTENGRGGASLEVAWKTSKGAELSAKFRLKRGDVSVETVARRIASGVNGRGTVPPLRHRSI